MAGTPSSINTTLDNGFIIAGQKIGYGCLYIKLDSNGNESWRKSYGDPVSDGANYVVQTSDTGYIITGLYYSKGFSLYKVDSIGNCQWAKTYGNANGDYYDGANCVRQTTDGGYIIAGSIDDIGAGGFDFYIIKTDSSGNCQWAYTYGGALDDFANYIQLTSDGGYIITGVVDSSITSYNSSLALLKIDSNGNQLWLKKFNITGQGKGSTIEQTTDGGYIIAGNLESSTVLLKTDINGNQQWLNKYGVPSSVFDGCSANQTSDYGYYLAGTCDNNTGTFDKKYFLLKTDTNGLRIW